MVNEINVEGFIASVIVFGILLGVTCAVAVNLGWHAFHLLSDWLAVRRERKREELLKEESDDFGREYQVAFDESVSEGDHTPAKQENLVDLMLDSRRKHPAVISIAKRLNVTAVKALRIHDESLEVDPLEHDGCPVCELGGPSVG